MIAAARELFDEIGFEDATIRLIAGRAGVSVGSVFTTFGGKIDILSHVMNERLEALYAELDRLAPHLRGPTVDRLRSIMAVHYSFESRRLRLFVAYISASFTWTPAQGLAPLGRNVRLRGMLSEALLAGVTRGEVREAVEIDLFIDTLMAAYIWNYRLTSQEGAEPSRLVELMDRQIGLLFDGVAAHPARAG